MYLPGGNLFLNTGGIDLLIGGNTYLGLQGLGKIDVVQDSPAEIKPLRFELNGVSSTMLSVVLTSPVQGSVVNLKLAIFDPATYLIIETHTKWSGFLDTLTVSDMKGKSTISANAEHAGIDLLRPSGSIYSDSEQQRLYPGDPSLQYLTSQIDMRVVWPSAQFFFK